MDHDRPLFQRLREYAAGPSAPLHMPGHKRNTRLLGDTLPYALDLTEIEGFDNLHEASGILAEGMTRAATLYGSDRAFYLVGGDTAGILAGIRAATRPGDRVLVARNCHRSVYHAIELCRLRPCYLCPPIDPMSGLCGSIPPQRVEEALRCCPGIRLVVLTSPTYEGVLSDIASIAQICHTHNIPLFVDEAHGAHLGFGPFGPGAVAAGADIVAHSLHKTLPSLTQTGLLHVSGPRIDPNEAERQLALFQSSSPSYPLMASIDRCVRLMAGPGQEWAEAHRRRLDTFDRALSGLKRLWSPGHADLWPHPVFFGLDPSKIYLSCRATFLDGHSLTGRRLAEILREEYQIETEMAAADGLLAMTSLCDEDETLHRFAHALCEIDRRCEGRLSGDASTRPDGMPSPIVLCSIEQALLASHDALPLNECPGRTAAEYVWAYPPGIPLLVPGEQITEAFVSSVLQTLERGIVLHSVSHGLPQTLRVCVP